MQPNAGELAIAAGDLAVEQVAHAKKSGHELGCGSLVEVLRRAELLDAPGAHDGDPVGHRHRLFLVVGDVDEGDADLGLDPLQLELHLLAQLEVERAERLVEEQHARMVDQGPRQRDALLLAAGELRWLALLIARQLDQLEQRGDLLPHLAVGYAAAAEAERDVLEDGEVRKEGVVLEDGVHVALEGRQAGHIGVAEVDRPAARLLEAADHAQGGRLAAAGGPRREKNSPRSTVSDRSSTAVTSPKRLVTRSSRMSVSGTCGHLGAKQNLVELQEGRASIGVLRRGVSTLRGGAIRLPARWLQPMRLLARLFGIAAEEWGMAKLNHQKRQRPRPLPARRHRIESLRSAERRIRREMERWRRS